MKIYMNRDVVEGAWGGGNHAVRAIRDNLNLTIPGAADAFLVIGMDQEGGHLSFETIQRVKLGRQKIFLRVNECDARKGTTHVDGRLIRASSVIDGTIFVSHWMYDYFMTRGWVCKNNVVITNGVDFEAFKPIFKEEAQVRPMSIVTHHWSDNPMKGQDYVEWLDDFVGRHPNQFQYTYVGRTKAQLKNSKLIAPLWGKELGKELASHDICVNASRFDPGPNSVIESIACGLPTYVHVDGGGGLEFAGRDHSFSSFEDLEKILVEKQLHTVNSALKLKSWFQFAQEVSNFMSKE